MTKEITKEQKVQPNFSTRVIELIKFYKTKFEAESTTFDAELQLLKLQGFLNKNRDRVFSEETVLNFFKEGLKRNWILDTDYWVVPYNEAGTGNSTLTFVITKDGHKKWLAKHFDVLDIKTNIVWKKDAQGFKIDIFNNKILEHFIQPSIEKMGWEDVYGAYGYIKYKDKNADREEIMEKTVWLNANYLHRVMSASKTSKAWNNWFDSMIETKVMKRLMQEFYGLVEEEFEIPTYKLDEAIEIDMSMKTMYPEKDKNAFISSANTKEDLKLIKGQTYADAYDKYKDDNGIKKTTNKIKDEVKATIINPMFKEMFPHKRNFWTSPSSFEEINQFRDALGLTKIPAKVETPPVETWDGYKEFKGEPLPEEVPEEEKENSESINWDEVDATLKELK